MILDEKCITPRQRRAIQLIAADPAADTADSPVDLAHGTADEAADWSADGGG